ncbi:MAG: hypothetical protein ACRD2C_27440 [Acidimicrobiales bacterium]
MPSTPSKATSADGLTSTVTPARRSRSVRASSWERSVAMSKIRNRAAPGSTSAVAVAVPTPPAPTTPTSPGAAVPKRRQ